MKKMSLIETPADLLDEFLAVPIGLEENDPRFAVRRGTPEDYERIYDCVDEAFGKVRPRVAYDWLYRKNPNGRARTWIVEDRETGRILKTGAYYPWPIWRGDEPLRGSVSGDAATVPDWQRKGLSAIRRRIRKSHPWSKTIASIAGPNEGSRIVTTKAGEGDSILGALPAGVAVLRSGPVLEKAGLPGGLARGLGVLGDPVFSLVRRLGRGRGNTNYRFEQIDRVTSELDAVTLETMKFPYYWCPHNADFLNWRYLDHPLESYSAFALLEGEQPVAYSVVRFAGAESTLSEFAASPEHAPALMAKTLEVAHASGAAFVNFFAPRVWRHWPLFRRSGFIPYRSSNYLDAGYDPKKEEAENVDHWQITPGDRDYH